MKNILLKDNDVIELIVKIYADGSVRFVQRWKNTKVSDERFYLMSDEVEILKANLNQKWS